MVYFYPLSLSEIFLKNVLKSGVGTGQFDAGFNGLRKDRSKIFLNGRLDWLLVSSDHVSKSHLLIATTCPWKNKVSSYHLKLTNKNNMLHVLQQKQEIWLVVYSRSNLIGMVAHRGHRFNKEKTLQIIKFLANIKNTSKKINSCTLQTKRKL